MKTYRIIPLALSTIDIDLSVLTYRYNLGKKLKLPIYMWYIDGADKHILVDTGCSAKYAEEHRPARARRTIRDHRIPQGADRGTQHASCPRKTIDHQRLHVASADDRREGAYRLPSGTGRAAAH